MNSKQTKLNINSEKSHTEKVKENFPDDIMDLYLSKSVQKSIKRKKYYKDKKNKFKNALSDDKF
jgi:hypothetical protein